MFKEFSLSQERQAVVEYLERQLIGPADGAAEELPAKSRPDERYIMGALYPPGIGLKNANEEYDSDEGASDDPVSLAYQQLPASVGLSFFTRSPVLQVAVAGAIYSECSDGVEKTLKRTELFNKESPQEVSVTKDLCDVSGVLGGRCNLRSIWRPRDGGWLVTVTLINAAKLDDGKYEQGDVVYQSWLRCSVRNGTIESYPSPDRYSWDPEEEELALIYDSKKTFAIGHGAAATWDVKASSVTSVETTFLPTYEVPPVTADFPKESKLFSAPVFGLSYLASEDISFSKKAVGLQEFIDDYKDWIDSQVKLAGKVGKFPGAVSRVLGRLNLAFERMQKGLNFLIDSKRAQRCFQLANLAMFQQMVHSHEDYAGSERKRGHENPKPDYDEKRWDAFKWRPFQLAFQLTVVESLANRNSTDREVVDLIWFPTGGGKTEAYLAIAAFELFWRRMQYGEHGGGTAVIKRYTLRLLTSQQFQRASALICACENIRRLNSDELGDEPYSLGLWVGGDTSPNKFKDAHQQFREVLDDTQPTNPFQLLKCPWCGCSLMPEQQELPENYGVRCDDSYFEFFCPDNNCDFHDHLPINVVDDHLYQHPPSFLVGTIDKFARLAWLDQPRAFFGGGSEGERHPPSLIIQDELHLISGPLGTVAGLYEAAMDVVMASSGASPKYIAATATIRRAEEQVKRLYSRPVAVFPPSGIDVRDSYFSREQSNAAGRLYAGVLSPHQSPVFSLAGTAAALAQAPVDVPLSDDARDGYWTQIIFHNSRRELGKTMTLARDDIPKRVAVLAKDPKHVRSSTDPIEMSANIPSRDIPGVLEHLKQNEASGSAVDVLPCTNMLSVGVDVQRLGLIMMNGQPKTTAEYIQASSRVGRGKIPGLVVAFYPNNKARDRSHFESFIPYHQALYRAVEPTSVTPFAQPAMERALHAALVIVMRYSGGCSGKNGAEKFDKDDPKVKSFLDKLRARLIAASDGSQSDVDLITEYLQGCVDMWDERAKASGGSKKALRYDAGINAKNFDPLLASYSADVRGKPTIPWATLNSMRNIDGECAVHVRGED